MSIVIETSGSWTYTGTGNQTESFTCPAGTDLLVIILATYAVGTNAQTWDLSPDALTYNSSALTSAVNNTETSTNRQRRVDVFYLVNPDTGSAYNLYYDPGQVSRSMLTALALSGCDTSDPIGATHTADLASTDIVETITTDTDNSLVVAGVSIGDNADVALTEDSNTTELDYQDWDDNSYDPTLATGYRAVGSAGNYDVGWTADSAIRSAYAAAEIHEEPATSYTLTADVGALALTGQAATLDIGLSTAYGPLALVGQEVTFGIVVPTPDERVFIVPAQARTHTPQLQARTHTPALQNRTITPQLQARTATPPAQSRTYEVPA